MKSLWEKFRDELQSAEDSGKAPRIQDEMAELKALEAEVIELRKFKQTCEIVAQRNAQMLAANPDAQVKFPITQKVREQQAQS